MTPSPCVSGTISVRDCMRGRCSVSTNSPPVKSSPGRDTRKATCNGKAGLAVELGVRQMVVADPVREKGWRGLGLSGLVTAREIGRVIAWTPQTDRHRLVPTVGDVGKRRKKRAAQRRH